MIRRPPELLSADPFFPQFAAGVETAHSPLGYALLLQVVPDAPTTTVHQDVLAGKLQDLELPEVRLMMRGSAAPAPGR